MPARQHKVLVQGPVSTREWRGRVLINAEDEKILAEYVTNWAFRIAVAKTYRAFVSPISGPAEKPKKEEAEKEEDAEEDTYAGAKRLSERDCEWVASVRVKHE